MTTPERAALYLRQHLAELAGKGYAVFNPHNKPLEELPVIYGFNNGGPHGFMYGQLIAEDGMPLGSHVCSHEGYMLSDLGILEGSRPDRHEDFHRHYPDGYRMEFIGSDAVDNSTGLLAALDANKARSFKSE